MLLLLRFFFLLPEAAAEEATTDTLEYRSGIASTCTAAAAAGPMAGEDMADPPCKMGGENDNRGELGTAAREVAAETDSAWEARDADDNADCICCACAALENGTSGSYVAYARNVNCGDAHNGTLSACEVASSAAASQFSYSPGGLAMRAEEEEDEASGGRAEAGSASKEEPMPLPWAASRGEGAALSAGDCAGDCAGDTIREEPFDALDACCCCERPLPTMMGSSGSFSHEPTGHVWYTALSTRAESSVAAGSDDKAALLTLAFAAATLALALALRRRSFEPPISVLSTDEADDATAPTAAVAVDRVVDTIMDAEAPTEDNDEEDEEEVEPALGRRSAWTWTAVGVTMTSDSSSASCA